MTTSINETAVEDTAMERFGEAAYGRLSGAAVDDATERVSAESATLAARVNAALRRLNPHLSDSEVEQVVRTVTRPTHPTLVENNRWFHALLTDGVEIEYKDAQTGENRGGRARLIDFDSPANNDFLAVR